VLLAGLVGFLLIERSDLNRSVAELSRVQALEGKARELSLYVQYNAHDTNAYTLGHVEHRLEYVSHAEQFNRVVRDIEHDLSRSSLDQTIELTLNPIRPTRARYERASERLFRAADRNRRAPAAMNQQRQDAAWEQTHKLGDQLDDHSQVLARALGTKARGLQGGIDQRNDQILAIVLALALMVGLLVMVIQSAVGRAKTAAQASRRRAEAVLSQNQSILNAAGEGILGIDSDGLITFVNPAGSLMTGYEVEELVGQSKRDMIHHSRPDGTPYPDQGSPVSMSLRDGTVQHADDEAYWRKDGSSFPVEYTITPITEGDRVTGAVVVFKDITERREMGRTKDEFTAVVSHELRTPLTSIRGSLGLLESGVLGPLPEKGQRMVEIAVQNTDRLVRLINDILDIERIASGTIDMQQELCDGAELVERSVQGVAQLAADAQVSLVTEGERVALFADPDRVVQTLTNLISNAVKFSPPGACVRVSSAAREGEALFEVADEGRGIPTANLESIFERFQQVDASDSREKGGTGLGLAICQTIVEHHGGRIWVNSTAGVGSTFSFVLPAVKGERVLAAEAASGDGPLVLVCDDDASVVEVVGAMLTQRGYRVIEAHSGEQALQRALDERPDAILLDLLMPGMSGWETAAALKRHPETDDIPVVILSVFSEGESEAPDGPVVSWLEKPLDERALFEALEHAVNPHGEPFKVLIIEDDADLAEILTAMFERHGIVSWMAGDGREAIELSQRVLPDLLVLDIGLPEADGFEVVDWLRRHERLRAVPLVVYTARELDEHDRERLRLGATTEFLTKGRITPQDFEQRVMRLLGRLTREPAVPVR